MSGSRALVLAVVLLGACGDDGPGPGDAGSDLPGEAGPDSSVPFTLAKGTSGHPDVAAKLGPGQVRAGRVTDASQLLAGAKVEGKVGDYKLYNDRVAFIIRDERWSDGHGPFGGELLDAARIGGESFLGELLFSAGARLLAPSSVGVVADGSDGKAAVVRAIGEPELFPFLVAMLGAGFGGKLPVHLVLDYVLEPDSDLLEVRLRIFNKTHDKVTISAMGLGISAGDGVEYFAEDEGFAPTKGRTSDHLAMVGAELSYLLYSPDSALTNIMSYEGLSLYTGDPVELAAAGEAQRVHRLALGDGEPEAVWRLLRQLKGQPEPTVVTGGVQHAGATVAKARVHVERDDTSGAYVTMSRTDASGQYHVALAPGKYRLRVAADGYELTQPVAVQVGASPQAQDLSLGGTASLSCTVTDAGGAALPAKLVFRRAVPLAVPPASFGEPDYPDAALILFTTDGKGTAKLPPGDYEVTASRGFEYEIDQASVTLADGDAKSVALQLTRSVDSTGYLCGDFHVHGTRSADSSERYEVKVAALAAEGVELSAVTDHDYVADLDPHVNKLGLQQWVRGMGGEEITSYLHGHFNLFPIAGDPSKPNMGALLWHDKTPAALFAEARKTHPTALLQIDHPRSGSDGYLDHVQYDPATGSAGKPALWSTDFDVLEVFNKRGWTDSAAAVQDWFSMLNRGLLVTATGNSDCHTATHTEAGYPRNCIALSTDEPAKLALTELVKAIKDQQVMVSGGPFVTVQVGGMKMGDVAIAGSKQATLAVKVQAPTWMPVDTLRVFLGGSEVHTVTLDSTTADPTNPVVRYEDTLALLPDKDSWVVVVVTGNGTLAPVTRNDEPFAMTNPIYLDVDGNGVYDPPDSFALP